jgi:DNA (cytosine-5)-methyltransferase 1
VTRDDVTIDLFAGPGGWDEGVRSLGLRPFGIEIDAAACETARAAGHYRDQADISTLDPKAWTAQHVGAPVRGLIASPPCQGFSQAGKQHGRQDAATLLAAIPEMVSRDVRPELRAGMKDSRSILVLEPLRWALALTPSWMAWEQVPAVLPIWEVCADVLRSLGYSVAVGNLQAETFGVPQTRKRAILVARAPWAVRALGGPAALPTPTHSRYFPRNPGKLDPGVLPWVSMAEALGWGMTARPYPSVAGGTGGGPDPLLVGGSHARGVVYGEHDAGRWVQQVPYGASGQPGDTYAERGRAERDTDHPSFTVTTKSKSYRWQVAGGVAGDGRPTPQDVPSPTVAGKGTASWIEDPTEYVRDERRTQIRMGTHEKATVRDEDEPAPTVFFGHQANDVRWLPASDPARRRSQGEGTAVRVTVHEAAVLQSFPHDYPWQGTKTAQYRQVGDAVPPLLAHRIVSAVAGITVERPTAWPWLKPAPTVVGGMNGVLPKPGQTHHKAQYEITAFEADDDGDAA